MHEDEIKQSLNELWDDTIYNQKKFRPRHHHKADSFVEVSDWADKHRYLNNSIILPRISEELAQKPQTHRVVQSHSSDYLEKKEFKSNINSVNIKFGLPQGVKGFQNSFYGNYLKEKINKKGVRVQQNEYICLQDHIREQRLGSKDKAKSEQEMARQSIINRVMNRRNRLKKQHFLQEYLTANKLGQPDEINLNQ